MEAFNDDELKLNGKKIVRVEAVSCEFIGMMCQSQKIVSLS